MTKVVIIGGGFGGIKTALELAHLPDITVTLVTPHKRASFYQPLQVVFDATQPISREYPLTEIFKGISNITLLNDTVTDIEATKHRLVTAQGKLLDYDMLVCALGMKAPDTDLPHIYSAAAGIKLRQLVRRLQKRQKPARLAVVGAGITGVSLAASLQSQLVASQIDIYEAEAELLPHLQPSARHYALRYLRAHGVTPYLGKKAEQISTSSVTYENHERSYDAVIWAGGRQPQPFFAEHHKIFSLSAEHRVVVNQHLMASPNIFVIGDAATGHKVGSAQVALHMAVYVATFIRRHSAGQATPAYVPFEPLYYVPLGPKSGILQNGQRCRSGRLAWLSRNRPEAIIADNFPPLAQRT